GAGKRGPPAALLSPPSSSEDEADEAPEEVSFGVAREAAETERKLVGEAARRHRELLKEKRRRRQELFTEQKVRRPFAPSPRLHPGPGGQRPRPANCPLPRRNGSCSPRPAAKQRQGQGQRQEKTDKRGKGARSTGNYTALCLKDQSLTGLHQQLAKDFLNTHLYGPDTNRAQGK
ncbi:NOL7 protein, partial [Pelecanoides urinatrix]|nr:NOL7 protein [Pelecanoides urinatrix]